MTPVARLEVEIDGTIWIADAWNVTALGELQIELRPRYLDRGITRPAPVTSIKIKTFDLEAVDLVTVTGIK